MSSTTFNAITYANKLKKAGMDVKVADVQDLNLMELKIQGFIVKALVTAVSVIVSILGILQVIMHFMK
jgi:S-adenosylhomocysteine hydrolase